MYESYYMSHDIKIQFFTKNTKKFVFIREFSVLFRKTHILPVIIYHMMSKSHISMDSNGRQRVLLLPNLCTLPLLDELYDFFPECVGVGFFLINIQKADTVSFQMMYNNPTLMDSSGRQRAILKICFLEFSRILPNFSKIPPELSLGI